MYDRSEESYESLDTGEKREKDGKEVSKLKRGLTYFFGSTFEEIRGTFRKIVWAIAVVVCCHFMISQVNSPIVSFISPISFLLKNFDCSDVEMSGKALRRPSGDSDRNPDQQADGLPGNHVLLQEQQRIGLRQGNPPGLPALNPTQPPG